jgi:hypothetical protein
MISPLSWKEVAALFRKSLLFLSFQRCQAINMKMEWNPFLFSLG